MRIFFVGVKCCLIMLMHHFKQQIYIKYLVGGWTNLSETICASQIGLIFTQFLGVNITKKIEIPPPRKACFHRRYFFWGDAGDS